MHALAYFALFYAIIGTTVGAACVWLTVDRPELQRIPAWKLAYQGFLFWPIAVAAMYAGLANGAAQRTEEEDNDD